jgi:hypothetical protein
MQTIDDEDEHLQGLRQANALFTYAERTLCTCAQCALCFITNASRHLLKLSKNVSKERDRVKNNWKFPRENGILFE